MLGYIQRALKWAELPPREDIVVWEGTTRWGNHDLYPIPKKEKNYGILGYFSYFIVSGVSIYGFTTASSYVTAGLNSWNTVAAIIVGSLIAVDKKLGFTMMSRVTFGLWGKLFPLAAPLIGNIISTGIQAYYGGQAVTLILGAVIPQFKRKKNTLPDSAAITTRDLIGFFIYFLCYLPVVFLVPMHKLRRYLYPCCIMTALTFFGMLGWAIKQNGGTGPIVSPAIQLTTGQRAFTWLQCCSSTAAVWGGSGDRLSDWTRFGKSRHSATPALLFGLVLAITPTAILGILITSAFQEMYGTQIWTPLGMLLYVQGLEYTGACRAGTFFAGVGLLANQIYINIVQNTMAFGMDACGLLPRYMSIKRATILLSMISIACNPWRFLSQASIFIEAMSVFAVFATATTSILISDYFIVRKGAWKIPDLYHQDGIYWYFHGFNPRAVTAWILAVIPSIPGFAHSMVGKVSGADYNIYQMTFFVGFPLVTFYLLINKFFPPPGLGISEDLEGYNDADVIDGLSDGQDVEATGEKEKDVFSTLVTPEVV